MCCTYSIESSKFLTPKNPRADNVNSHSSNLGVLDNTDKGEIREL